MIKTSSKTNSSANSSKASTMDELLKKSQKSFTSLNKGENLEGVITKLTPSEILVDVNAKTEAVVMEKDKRLLRLLLSSLKVGDKVTVSVLNPESDMGYPVVSLRRFLDDLTFGKLENLKKEKKQVEIIVDSRTGGGYLVSTSEGVSGFLPNSQVSFDESGQDIVGKKIKALVLELNRPMRKIIFSQKATIGVEDFEKTIKSLKIDQKITTTVLNVTPFGIFVSIPTSEKSVEGLIHISEISWDKVSNIEQMFSPGEEIDAVIIGFDKKAKRAELSVKRLTEDPFEESVKKYAVDQKVKGKVSQISQIGVSVDLAGAEGFIRKEKIPPTVTYEIGQEITATISEIDKRRRRVVLSPVLKEKPIGYK